MLLVPLALLACSEQGIKALNADPAAEITDPADGATVTGDEVVSLRGVATDPETDPTELRVTWLLDGAIVCEGTADADGGTT